MEIIINDRICLMCGEEITHGNRIKAHLIPKTLKPFVNVITHFHKDCEQKLNALYVSQARKPEHEKAKKKILNTLKDFETKIKIMKDRIKEDE